jgi:hypothetical protein
VQDYATVSFKMETSSDDLTPRPALKTSSISMPPFLVVATLASGRSITYGVQIRPCESPSSKKKSGWEWEPCRQVVRYMQTAMQRIDENLERGRRGQGCRYRRILDETLSCLVWLERLSWVLRAESCLSPDT